MSKETEGATKTASEKAQADFLVALRARCSMFWVVTNEERRTEVRLTKTAMAEAGYDVICYDIAGGAKSKDGKVQVEAGKPPAAMFERIRKRERKEFWILRDLHAVMNDPRIVRNLKNLYREAEEETDVSKIFAVAVVTSSRNIPDELKGYAQMIDWPLPDRDEIEKILTVSLKGAGLSEDKFPEDEELNSIVEAASGLTANDVTTSIAGSLVKLRKVDPEYVSLQKRQIVDREGLVQWFAPEPRGMDAIGGLESLKEWLLQRRLGFTPEAREYGLPVPRGLLMAGVPGCGKSLMAKAIATAWGFPLIRLDLGSLKGSLVGQSEQNIRRALKLVESIAPAVIWVDEIEKALQGSESRGDGGVSADALGHLLTWLQEREKPVFAAFTANDVSGLPPELTRKGRLDEIFFVDLPTDEERAAIAATTLVKFERDPEDFDLEEVAKATEKFSGAEIAELIPTAMFASFEDDARDLTTQDLLDAAALVRPIADQYKEKIDYLRGWSKNRARNASLNPRDLSKIVDVSDDEDVAGTAIDLN